MTGKKEIQVIHGKEERSPQSFQEKLWLLEVCESIKTVDCLEEGK